jgi:hypothetical protein
MRYPSTPEPQHMPFDGIERIARSPEKSSSGTRCGCCIDTARWSPVFYDAGEPGPAVRPHIVKPHE